MQCPLASEAGGQGARPEVRSGVDPVVVQMVNCGAPQPVAIADGCASAFMSSLLATQYCAKRTSTAPTGWARGLARTSQIFSGPIRGLAPHFAFCLATVSTRGDFESNRVVQRVRARSGGTQRTRELRQSACPMEADKRRVPQIKREHSAIEVGFLVARASAKSTP